MSKDKREIQRKLRVLRYAEEIGHVAKTCRYFGIGRASFYRWRKAYSERGEAGLINAPPIPKWHANRTPPEREENGPVALLCRPRCSFKPPFVRMRQGFSSLMLNGVVVDCRSR